MKGKRYYRVECPDQKPEGLWLSSAQVGRYEASGCLVRQAGFACPELEESRRYMRDEKRSTISMDDVLDLYLDLTQGAQRLRVGGRGA